MPFELHVLMLESLANTEQSVKNGKPLDHPFK